MSKFFNFHYDKLRRNQKVEPKYVPTVQKLPKEVNMNGKETKTFVLKKKSSKFWIFDAYWKNKDGNISLHLENDHANEVSDKVSFALNREEMVQLRDYLNKMLG